MTPSPVRKLSPRSSAMLAAITLLMMIAFHSAGAAPSPNPWLQTSPLLAPRSGAGVLEVNGVIYAIAGIDGKQFLRSSEYSAIHDDGTLAAWRAGSELNEARGFFGVAAHGGFLYAVGGGNGPSGHHLLRSVERAAVRADGSLGPWRETQQLNLPRRCAKVVASGDYLYAIGGFGGALLDSVERARFNGDGSLGPWEMLPDKLTRPRYIHAEAEVNGRLYIVGGHAEQGGMGEAAVEFTALSKEKDLSSWHGTAALIQGRYGLAAASHGDYLYALGGMSGATFYDVIEKNHVDADGALGVWHDTTPLPAPLADLGVVVYGDWMYVIGGTSPKGYFNSVYYARIDKRGDPAPAAAGNAPRRPRRSTAWNCPTAARSCSRWKAGPISIWKWIPAQARSGWPPPMPTSRRAITSATATVSGCGIFSASTCSGASPPSVSWVIWKR